MSSLQELSADNWGRGGEESALSPLCLPHQPLSCNRAQNSRVLVHCKMGVSRSASTVIAYAMKEYGWSLERAYRHVQDQRPIVHPNPSFMRQLEFYQGILDAR